MLARTWVLAGLVAVAMAGALAYGFTQGDFVADASRLTANPWGLVTLIECYIGYILIGAWIVQREPSTAMAAVWIVAMMLIGHLVTAAYLVRAAGKSGGRVDVFWMGRAAP